MVKLRMVDFTAPGPMKVSYDAIYVEDKKPVIKNIEMDVKSGERVTIVSAGNFKINGHLVD